MQRLITRLCLRAFSHRRDAGRQCPGRIAAGGLAIGHIELLSPLPRSCDGFRRRAPGAIPNVFSSYPTLFGNGRFSKLRFARRGNSRETEFRKTYVPKQSLGTREGAGSAGTCERRDYNDLHARSEPRGSGREKPARLRAGRTGARTGYHDGLRGRSTERATIGGVSPRDRSGTGDWVARLPPTGPAGSG